MKTPVTLKESQSVYKASVVATDYSYNYGDIQHRLMLNARRLNAPEYMPPLIFAQGGDWAGDWQGRALLALCCLYSALTDREEAKRVLNQADSIVDSLGGKVNEFGYFGDPFDGKTVNEQQLSGNSWFLRGLCEYYLITHSEKALDSIERISENFLVKLASFYKNYPLEDRQIVGDVSGRLLGGEKNGWILSTDIACAFIMLDGITHVYEITRDSRLETVIEAMTERFFGTDLMACNCQTHATLSALRGILRYYNTTGESRLLKKAVQMFDYYLSRGTTLNYANHNWFGRPLWTEPCAVTDSLIVCARLFEYIGDIKYLRLINRIYYNAFRSGMRPNGGAGCDTCLTEENTVMGAYLYEADFCCTMRIAEGLKELSRMQFLRRKDCVYAALYDDCKVGFGDLTLSAKFLRGGNGLLQLKADRIPHGGALYLYLPQGCSVRVNGVERTEKDLLPIYRDGNYNIEYSLASHTETAGKQKLNFLGDVLLTEKEGFDYSHSFVLENDGRKFTPITDCIKLPDKETVFKLRQRL